MDHIRFIYQWKNLEKVMEFFYLIAMLWVCNKSITRLGTHRIMKIHYIYFKMFYVIDYNNMYIV